jgi:hypothetical protein
MLHARTGASLAHTAHPQGRMTSDCTKATINSHSPCAHTPGSTRAGSRAPRRPRHSPHLRHRRSQADTAEVSCRRVPRCVLTQAFAAIWRPPHHQTTHLSHIAFPMVLRFTFSQLLSRAASREPSRAASSLRALALGRPLLAGCEPAHVRAVRKHGCMLFPFVVIETSLAQPSQ